MLICGNLNTLASFALSACTGVMHSLSRPLSACSPIFHFWFLISALQALASNVTGATFILGEPANREQVARQLRNVPHVSEHTLLDAAWSRHCHQHVAAADLLHDSIVSETMEYTLLNRKEKVTRAFILIVRHVRTLRTLPVCVDINSPETLRDPMTHLAARASLLKWPFTTLLIARHERFICSDIIDALFLAVHVLLQEPIRHELPGQRVGTRFQRRDQ